MKIGQIVKVSGVTVQIIEINGDMLVVRSESGQTFDVNRDMID